MNKAPVPVLLALALIVAGVPVSADYYASKQDYLAGKLTPGQPPTPKAGSDNCTSPTVIPATAGVVNFNDTGTTTGFFSTIAAVPDACTAAGFPASASGPDHIWQVTVGTTNLLRFEVTTSSATFDPMLYALGTCGDADSCMIGADNCFATDVETSDPAGPCLGVSTEAISHSFGTPGTYYLYVDSWYSVLGAPTRASGPYALEVTGTVPVELLNFTID